MREIKDLDELKFIELGIMKYIHLFCVENDIRYYLSHGTLLGAVRHKGFIPWDDDIDIFMPRCDYERFCDLFPLKAELLNLELVNHNTKRYYGRPISKIIDTRTVLSEKQYLGDDFIGVFVDIWPLDGIASDRRSFETQKKALSLLMKRLYINITRMNYVNGIKGKIKHLLSQIYSRKKCVEDIIELMKAYPYDTSQRVICYVDPYKAVMNQSWFGQGILLPFEDAEFFVPNEYDKVLKQLYGDYMKLPPKDKQIPHHISNVFWK